MDEAAPSGLGVATPQAMNSRRNDHCSVIKMKKLHYFKISHEKSKIGDRQCTKKQIITTDILNGASVVGGLTGQNQSLPKFAVFALDYFSSPTLEVCSRSIPKSWAGALGLGNTPYKYLLEPCVSLSPRLSM